MGSHQLLSMIVLKVDWSITDVYTGFVDDNNNDDIVENLKKNVVIIDLKKLWNFPKRKYIYFFLEQNAT